MKKEGIQTRNRKLSSKSKKKKAGGCLGLGGVMGDMIKASGHLDLDNKPFHSGFGSPMSKSRNFFPSAPIRVFLSPISLSLSYDFDYDVIGYIDTVLLSLTRNRK